MERWFATLRREYLERLLMLGHRHLAQVLRVYERDRPHRSPDQRAPIRSEALPLTA